MKPVVEVSMEEAMQKKSFRLALAMLDRGVYDPRRMKRVKRLVEQGD